MVDGYQEDAQCSTYHKAKACAAEVTAIGCNGDTGHSALPKQLFVSLV